MSKSKKKLKLKKWVKYTLTIIIIIIIILIILFNLPHHSKPQNKTTPQIKDLIQETLSYNLPSNITPDFLTWISKNYSKQTIINLNKYLKENPYDPHIWHNLTNNSLIVLLDLYNNTYENQSNVQIVKTKDKTTTINFIGDVSLADNWYIAPQYDTRQKGILGILSQPIVDILTTSDLTIANNEFTISSRGTKMPGKYYTFRASKERLNIYKEMGVDLVTLANNHVYDFGEVAFQDMLQALDEYNIPHIGAGANLKEATTPYYFVINGYKIAFVNANRSEKILLTPEATDTKPGVLRCYDPTIFANLISTTKQHSDYVIALIHWGKEDSHELEEVQQTTSKLYLDKGADLIVGTHAHVLQGIEFYQNKAIIYNLGDFIFNDETKDTAIFQLKIDNAGNFTYKIIPAKQEDKYTYLLEETEKQRVLNDILSYSSNIKIDSTGNLSPN